MRRAAFSPARAVAGLGLALSLTALAGCGPGIGKVSGKVTYLGKPVPGGLITFLPADPGHNSVAVRLDADGRYPAVDLPTGEVTVSIDNRELEALPAGGGGLPAGLPLTPEVRAKLGKGAAAAPVEGAPKTGDDVRRPSGRYVPIPEKYYMAETSGLKFTVKGGDQTQDFELTD